MSIFKPKKKVIEWTDATAPKKRQIQMEVSFELLLKGSSETYSTYNDVRVCKNNFNKALLVTTDATKESIKDEIADKLQNLYEEICVAIDNDESNFSNEYWYDKVVKEQEPTF